MEVFQEGASRAAVIDLQGASYIAVQLTSDHKPPLSHRLTAPELHISKTYCVDLSPKPNASQSCPTVRNYMFSDKCGHPQESLKAVNLREVHVADRTWRRGYYGSMCWNREAPKKGSQFTLSARMAEQDCNSSESDGITPWERKASRRLRSHATRRARALRIKQAQCDRVQRFLDNASVDSSSSSSTSL